MRPSCDLGRIESPKVDEGGVRQFQASIHAEDRHALLERIEGLALHADQRVKLRFEIEALRDVIEEISNAAQRIGTGDRAQGAPVRDVPDMLDGIDRLVSGEKLALPKGEVGLLGQLPFGAQTIENLVVGRLL